MTTKHKLRILDDETESGVRGGQGRTAREVEAAGMFFVWILLGVVVGGIAGGIFLILT